MTGSAEGAHDAARPETAMLLHEFLAALAFRFRHVASGAPEGFGDFDAGSGVRTPAALVLHMTGLVAWVGNHYEPEFSHELESLSFERECERFLVTVRRLDRVVDGSSARDVDALHPSSQVTFAQLWRGPLVDAMTHVGQLATLRRLAGSPVERVRYWQVDMSGALEDG